MDMQKGLKRALWLLGLEAENLIDALVMTLGFEPGPLVSSVASHAAEGFRQGAKIIVLTPGFHDERAERAWRQLQDIFDLMKLEEAGVTLTRHVINLDDFTQAIIQVKSLFSGFRDKKVHISLTGGMRALILCTFIAYLLTRWRRPPDVWISLEGRGVMLKVPSIAPILKPLVDENKLSLLKAMSPDRVYKPRELHALIGRDRSTLYRYLRALSDLGLIERVGGGFRVTELGRLLRA